MKKQHLSDADLDFFHDGILPARETIEYAEHLEICPECSDRLDEVRAAKPPQPFLLDLSLRTFLKDLHVFDEQLSDYLDGDLDEDDAEIVRVHIESCTRCLKDLLDLIEIRRQIKPELELRYRPPTRVGYIAKRIQMKVRKWLKLLTKEKRLD
jgi:anti-sigma factor RsiW